MTEEEQEQQMLFEAMLEEFARNDCDFDCNCDDHS